MNWRWRGIDAGAASYYSVPLWLVRLGLYQSDRSKAQADDWMWIVDQTPQMGERRCLIAVGRRRSAWEAENRVLSHEDVELVDLQSTRRRLLSAMAGVGPPAAAVVRDRHKTL